jgi:putative transcriptional regulator
MRFGLEAFNLWPSLLVALIKLSKSLKQLVDGRFEIGGLCFRYFQCDALAHSVTPELKSNINTRFFYGISARFLHEATRIARLFMTGTDWGGKLKMAKPKRDIGREILQGLREIKRGQHGRVVNIPSVASIREKTGLSQERCAALLGVSIRTLQDWEQGRRAPSGAARTLLLIAERNPKALVDVA